MVVQKWSIYWVALDPITDSEQAGTRPALVMSNDMVNEVLPVVTILPLSSVKSSNRVYSTEVLLSKNVSGLPKDSVVMIHQIRTIDKGRIGKLCGGIIDIGIRNRVDTVMKEYFEV